jgi:hypothetical protein
MDRHRARGQRDVRLRDFARCGDRARPDDGAYGARVETFELWWNGQPMASPSALMQACCSTTSAEQAQARTTAFSIGLAAPSILRAGNHSDFFAMAASPQNKDLWSKFNVERDKITVRVCYCSVFDECWRGSGITTHADRIASCPTPEVPYQLPGQR